MKERSIFFSVFMVRAILAGTKTQTRRVVNPKHCAWMDRPVTHQLGEWEKRPLPYGKTGDRLWVRETYWRDEEDGAILYAANPDDFEVVHHNKVETGSPRYNWKPSIFMPRWASRITLEVTGVRVERLQDISEADALAEGISRLAPPAPPHEWSGLNRFTLNGMGSGFCAGSVSWNSPTAKALYLRLWEDINGPGSWEANPWVWVIEFKRVQP